MTRDGDPLIAELENVAREAWRAAAWDRVAIAVRAHVLANDPEVCGMRAALLRATVKVAQLRRQLGEDRRARNGESAQQVGQQQQIDRLRKECIEHYNRATLAEYANGALREAVRVLEADLAKAQAERDRLLEIARPCPGCPNPAARGG